MHRILKNWNDYASAWRRGFIVNIGIIEACPLKCPSCWVGNGGKLTGATMSRELWQAVIGKVATDVKVRALIPSLYGDSMLHPMLPEFMRDCAPYNFPYIVIPSTLNRVNCDIRDVLQSGIHEFVISWSGWEHYGTYHKNGDLPTVLHTMEYVSSIKPKPVISVRFHRYKHNLHEEPEARKFCEALGFRFDSVNAYSLDVENMVHHRCSTDEKQFIVEHLIDNPFNNPPDDNCQMQNKHLTITSRGMARVCSCIYNPALEIGDYLSTPISTIKRIQRSHPWCERCKQSGVRHAYKIMPETT
jgi:MoaA/NifB/PqqE/SkfB family radical SAM enzyme